MITQNMSTGETWEASNQFRWQVREIPFDTINKERVLQQQWFRHGDYKTEWCDVPTAQEGEE